MKTNLLLPYGFKKIGWIVFIPTLILGCGITFFDTTVATLVIFLVVFRYKLWRLRKEACNEK